MIARLKFTKLGKVRWTSHRDVARMWERALRRAGLPVAYSGGFSPRPRLSFGLALPTGCESLAEYLDVALETDLHPEDVMHAVAPELPAGVGVVASGEATSGSGSLQEEVSSCTWEIHVPGSSPEGLRNSVSETMAAAHLPVERERKGRSVQDDLRPSLLSLSVADCAMHQVHEPERPSPQHMSGPHPQDQEQHPPAAVLVAELATRPRGVRPVELAHVMGIELGLSRRTRQWIERDGSKYEPLDERAAVAAVCVERAS
ncbi:MAG TPA: TIGR03936 family radical SAM-associated protein [Acidimicrobiales bacterium]|nr:TIGR03936 family radical SAM-associated protein [Acidimicrobiales bacterium]